MTDRDVTVQIDESILLGGERCRTTVHILQISNKIVIPMSFFSDLAPGGALLMNK